jgi:response regulator RpfG family c-di-GMP phosphodiesterase
MEAPAVLILDDEPLVVRALTRTLGNGEFQVHGYTDPAEALTALQVIRPDVIISDQSMPGLDGVSFLKQARARVPGAVRILCTAAEEFSVALRAVNAGEVFRIVRKPWEPHELLSSVREAVAAVRLQRENERLTTEVQRQNEQLRTMNQHLEEIVLQRSQALLEGLIAALDYRDAETQWHSRRVSLYARRLAQQLGIAEPELSVIEHGALLHDVGKIGVRDHVLLKPGPLSADEWIEMQRHAELGWALLQRVEHLRPSSILVLQHQERWDGSGYPAGLRHEEIMLGARVFHVVDAMDAMTSARPYRKGRSLAEARAEIARCSDTQFDPRVVQAFLEIPDEEWERIRVDVETVAVLTAELAERPPGPIQPDLLVPVVSKPSV